jgi:hypothetical protein
VLIVPFYRGRGRDRGEEVGVVAPVHGGERRHRRPSFTGQWRVVRKLSRWLSSSMNLVTGSQNDGVALVPCGRGEG